ncbi:hypothetical protein Tco_1110176 [Tanacetum coccineum]|uniref:Uncharacterized protein n=1 Tax=Tanacetum coccineum TaxID=301880 RepID=A0ABQ5IK64_9ASTR
MDRKVKSLKRSKIALVKVHWNSKRGPEFTWEREDYMKSKYPQLFVDRADESASNGRMVDQDTHPPTITAMKISIIKKGEYDIWSMRTRQYICHTYHNLWDIIVNGDLEDEATASAIPDEYLLKFHNVPDAKSLWAAIKSRFGGNEESKKMQKNVLKHQFENFVTTSNETLDKAYDRFQKLISQLEIHGAYPDIDEIDIDDLYNNLRVYEDEMKKSSTFSSNTQNLAFLSSENTNSTNEVSTASGYFRVSTAGGINQVPHLSLFFLLLRLFFSCLFFFVFVVGLLSVVVCLEERMMELDEFH